LTTPFIRMWEEYRDSRRATYEYRAQTRYRGVADKLFEMGLEDWHTVLDVGAGTCQFGRYLRERGWRGLYSPVDAVIDGVNLESFRLPFCVRVDYVVCMEVLEHLHNWEWLFSMIDSVARRGFVLTTPNPEVVDVLKCDPTHVSVIHPGWLECRGMTVERRSWFSTKDNPGQLDTLLAWRKR
jgi:SAM-dependent methyltransferase